MEAAKARYDKAVELFDKYKTFSDFEDTIDSYTEGISMEDHGMVVRPSNKRSKAYDVLHEVGVCM